MSDEHFVEVTRNNMVESRHFGAAVVCDHEGQVVESRGDIDRLMYPRALKPLLAIHLVKSGASNPYRQIIDPDRTVSLGENLDFENSTFRGYKAVA